LAEDAGPGEEASSLGPGAPVGGAGGPSNAGEGAGAPCFLVFLCFPGAGAGATGVVGAATGAAVGTGAGGELTGTGAGGELTGTGAGGELTGVAAGGDAAGGLVAGAGAATVGGDAAGVDAGVAALGDAAGGEDLGEATGAGDLVVEGAAAGVEAAGVVGVLDGADAGDWPPTPAITMQMKAREKRPLRSIGVNRSVKKSECV